MIDFRIDNVSPLARARIAGGLYLLNIILGVASVFFLHGKLASTAYYLASTCNFAVTLLLYGIFKPVSRRLTLLAAFFGLLVFVLGTPQWHPHGVDVAMIFFASYCLMIGYLIFRSAFLPRILGALMALAGLAWLTFLIPPLTHSLSPYNMAIGAIGQVALTLWLLVFGVNAQRWKEQADAAFKQ
ncbi:MAG: DUF4386 domain-containing protein [Terracidiphilus sp.]